jgi:hypothetical protein
MDEPKLTNAETFVVVGKAQHWGKNLAPSYQTSPKTWR